MKSKAGTIVLEGSYAVVEHHNGNWWLAVYIQTQEVFSTVLSKRDAQEILQKNTDIDHLETP